MNTNHFVCKNYLTTSVNFSRLTQAPIAMSLVPLECTADEPLNASFHPLTLQKNIDSQSSILFMSLTESLNSSFRFAALVA